MVEVTAKGELVWKLDNVGTICSAQRLANGNTLVSNQSRSKAEEYSRDKKVVWEHPHSSPTDAYRLGNGNTLITGSSTCVEVTRDKKVLWTKQGFSSGSARK